MIWLVTKQQELFNSSSYTIVSTSKAIEEINTWKVIQVDSETSGRDPHICDFLSVQLGNDKKDIRIVIDCRTIDIISFKESLENSFCVFQNAKFDLQFFYKHNIIIRNIYDTMIVEQMLYLGYPSGSVSFSLKALCKRYLDKDIDKTVRGEIIWRGLDEKVIIYGASDVTNLEQIMHKQVAICKQRNCLKGAKVECDAVPSVAYMEWCGIHLDENKWKAKMIKDKESLSNATKALNDFIIKLSKEGYKKPYKDDLGNTFYNEIPAKEFTKYVFINRQGDLFLGYNLEPQVNINWSSSKQVTKVAKLLGFNTTIQDKKTGEDKDSVLEKQLSTQKGICDEFIKLYFDYQGYNKVVTSFGQGHLNAINPIDGRLHTTFKQIGAASGRFSCGSNQPNTELAKYKKISPNDCKYPNLQQLPSDEVTRSCFTAPEGSLFVSCDFSAEESRLSADIYNDKEFRKEFLERTGDTHSMFAWAVFRKQCQECGCKSAMDVKKLAPQWRKKVKAVEFAYLFGAAAPTISKSADCSVEEAQSYIDTLDREFSGVSSFAKKGSLFVRSHGYIVINPITGHKVYWWDWNKWKEENAEFTQKFWEEYRDYHKGTNDEVAQKVRHHFQSAGYYDRLARNAVTQGTGAIIMKTAMKKLFDWIVDNGWFNKVHICVCVHDELDCDYPKECTEFPKVLEEIMEDSAAIYCKSLPIPADPEVSNHWVH